MRARFDAIRSGSFSLDSLASPSEVNSLLFPQTFHPLPSDRFRIKEDGTVDFMGREKLREIYQQWDRAFVQRSGLLAINVYGTPGSIACTH